MKATLGTLHLRYLEHVKTNICNCDEKVFAYLIHWMARAVQKPDARGEVAIVLHGDKSTGKSVFADMFGQLFGDRYWAMDDASRFGRFGNARLRDCVVLFSDEAFWAGDRKRDRVLKTLVSERTLVIEAKGSDPEKVTNKVHLIMAGNSEWVVPVSAERRFLVLDVAKTRQGDKDYFGAITRDMEDGGFGNLLYVLQTMDLSHFDPRDVPQR